MSHQQQLRRQAAAMQPRQRRSSPELEMQQHMPPEQLRCPEKVRRKAKQQRLRQLCAAQAEAALQNGAAQKEELLRQLRAAEAEAVLPNGAAERQNDFRQGLPATTEAALQHAAAQKEEHYRQLLAAQAEAALQNGAVKRQQLQRQRAAASAALQRGAALQHGRMQLNLLPDPIKAVEMQQLASLLQRTGEQERTIAAAMEVLQHAHSNTGHLSQGTPAGAVVPPEDQPPELTVLVSNINGSATRRQVIIPTCIAPECSAGLTSMLPETA